LIDRSVSDQNVEVRFVAPNEGAWAWAGASRPGSPERCEARVANR